MQSIIFFEYNTSQLQFFVYVVFYNVKIYDDNSDN